VGVVGLRMYLAPSLGCEFDPMVWYELVNVAVLVPFGLGVADQDNHLPYISNPFECMNKIY
jgi:hypothetical protein